MQQYLDDNIIIAFEKYLRESEKSPATVEKYVRDVRAFRDYYGCERLEKSKIIEYKQMLISKGYSPRSINSMTASVNKIFAFMGCAELKIKPIKLQQQIFCSPEKELSRKEYERLCMTAKNKGNMRLYLLIQTICGTGIRVSELKYITVEAVRSGKAEVSCKSKTRAVFIVKELQKKLLKYADKRNIRSGPVFITRSGKPMCRNNIWKEMKALCGNAGVCADKVFPHNLRHLFARVFYKTEKDIAKLADILGHSSINTTRIYIISTGTEHRRRMENMHLII